MFRRCFLLSLLFIIVSGVCGQNTREQCIQSIKEGKALLSRFRPAESLRQFDTAILLAEEIQNEVLKGEGLLGVGQALWYMGQSTAAIDTLNRAIYYLRKHRKQEGATWLLASSLRIISNIYDETGHYEEAFISVREALEIFTLINDKQNVVLSLVQLGSLFRSIGDFQTAQVFFDKAKEKKPAKGSYEYRELNHQFGRLYSATSKFDSAMYCYQSALLDHPNPLLINLRIGECYLLKNSFSNAYKYLIRVYTEAQVVNELKILAPAMIGLGNIYLQRGQLDSTLIMGNGALSIAIDKGVRQDQRDASLMLAMVYKKMQKKDSALLHYEKYVALKDAILTEQFKGQLYTFKRRSEDAVTESHMRLLKGGIVGVIILSVVILLLVALRYKNEKLRLRRRSSELEMLALRAQMNPHFIFNCLSAINHTILDNDTDKASDYLTRFAGLIRLVLINADKNSVTLEEELSMLKLYLDMEQLRFTDTFDYHINYDGNIQPSMVVIPSFILQPFCENAIWHGLLHKDGKRELIIDLSMKRDVMIFSITDNGIGRAKASAVKTENGEIKKSFGIKLATERLALFNNSNKLSGSFNISDVLDLTGNVTGTKVTIQIINKTSR